MNLDWLNTNAGASAVLVTAVLVVVTAVYVWLMRSSVKELERQRLATALPVVVGIWEIPTQELALRDAEFHPVLPYLHIRNCGNGPALDVSMTVDSNVGIGLHGEKTRKWVLRALEPSGQHNTGIAQYVDTSEKPAFDVTIESHDIHNRRVVTRHTMDVDGCLYMEVNGKILVGKKP